MQPRWYILVAAAAAAVVRRSAAPHAFCVDVINYADLASCLDDDVGGTVVADPSLLPGDARAIREWTRRRSGRLVFVAAPHPASVRHMLAHGALDPADVHLVSAGTERLERPLGSGPVLWYLLLRALATRLGRAPDDLLAAMVAALCGSGRVDSVKVLSAFCGVSSRTVERWFADVGLVPKRFLASARFVRVRSALEAGDTPDRAARAAGYSCAKTMWRAVRRELALDPRAFRHMDTRNMLTCVLALLHHHDERAVAGFHQ